MHGIARARPSGADVESPKNLRVAYGLRMLRGRTAALWGIPHPVFQHRAQRFPVTDPIPCTDLWLWYGLGPSVSWQRDNYAHQPKTLPDLWG